ncbi:hypothetical protein CO229_00335 [Mycoplasmopsis bovirhinis]|uniref:MYPU_1760 family metalloprotease n=1 Tax=Mycoplasmopsis bovirhinis TaxID=29553 RepID=UPI000C059744|nr:hypothetical protein [Mycoplasmopsis bovirhinis]ATO30585.1 hypothetical protein CO229_00335 [Mycoplasmopsis bovirhinis]
MKRSKFLLISTNLVAISSFAMVSCDSVEKPQKPTPQPQPDPSEIAVNNFKTAYAGILSKNKDNITLEDENSVNVALSAFSLLEDSVKQLLTAEKSLLDDLLAKIAEIKQSQTNETNLPGENIGSKKTPSNNDSDITGLNKDNDKDNQNNSGQTSSSKEQEKTPVEDTGSTQPEKPLEQEKVVINKFLPINEGERYFSSLNSQEKQKELNELNYILYEDINKVEQKSHNGLSYLEYKDKITGIIFKEYSYGYNQSGPLYLLNKEGLLLIAHEFKRKIPYGQEVKDLDSITINNVAEITSQSLGLYRPLERRIYVNGTNLNNKGFSLYEIVGSLMQTIFHEYMHHWAMSYAETGLIEGNKLNVTDQEAKDINQMKTTELYYNPAANFGHQGHSHGQRQFWNSYFVSNFYNLLNYYVSQKGYLSDEVLDKLNIKNKENLLYNNLSINDMWRLANELNTPEHLKNKSQSQTLSVSPSGVYTTSINRLKYTFSMTELVPREYTKYAYESYFSINDLNKSAQRHDARQSTLNWFGLRYYTQNENNQWMVFFYPSHNTEDWSHTYLNNFDSLTARYWFDKLGNGLDNPTKHNVAIMPNSVFEINEFRFKKEGSESEIGELAPEKTRSRSKEFYKLFLDTMGYGKTISQVFYRSDVKDGQPGYGAGVVGWPDRLKFSGFIDANQKADGLVIKDANGEYKHSLLEYSNNFNFFGLQNFDQGANLYSEDDKGEKLITKDRQKQISNRLYPNNIGYNNYLSYITKDFLEVKENSEVYLWTDLNKDGKVTENELNSSQITLPTQRPVTNQRNTNHNVSNFDKFIIKNIDGKTVVKKL